MSEPGPEQAAHRDDTPGLEGTAGNTSVPLGDAVDEDASLHNMGGASGPADVGAARAGDGGGGGGLGPSEVRAIAEQAAEQRQRAADDDS
jgi:hypothetical protein